MSKRVLYREYDEEGNLIKLECSHCHEVKKVNCYYKNKNCKNGINTKCKDCIKNSSKQYYENNKGKVLERIHQYQKNNRDKIIEYNIQYYIENREKEKELRHERYINNREKEIQNYYKNRNKRITQMRKNYKNKSNTEIMKIYEHITKNLYPNNGIQYGIIYGVHCKPTDRWYIGQTVKSFKLRYYGDFFNHKFNDLLENNDKCQLLQDDLEKYGQEKFEIFEVLDVAFSEKELDEKEAYYIDYYKAYDEGYNSNRGNIFKHNKPKRKEVI